MPKTLTKHFSEIAKKQAKLTGEEATELSTLHIVATKKKTSDKNVTEKLSVKNGFGDTNLQAISLAPDVLDEKSAKEIASLIRYHNKLNYECPDSKIRWYNFGQKIDRGLVSGRLRAPIKGSHERIQALDVSNNKITPELAWPLYEAVYYGSEDKTFDFFASNCKITDKTLGNLLHCGLATNDRLRSLDLSNNAITNDGLKTIFKTYGNARYSARYYDLSNNKITDKGAKDLIKLLEVSTDIVKFDLSGNKISKPLLTKINQHLEDNRVIQKMRNNMRNQTINLRSSLGKHLLGILMLDAGQKTPDEFLKDVKKAEMKIDDKTIPRLRKMLDENFKIHSINLCGLSLSDKQAKDLQQLLIDFPSVRVVENMKNEKAHPEIGRIARLNKVINKTIDNKWYSSGWRQFFRGFVHMAVFQRILAILTIPLNNFFFLLTAAAAVGLTMFSARTSAKADKTALLEGRKPKWTQGMRDAAKLGRECQKSILPWFRPTAWSNVYGGVNGQALQLGYSTKVEDKLLPIDPGYKPLVLETAKRKPGKS